jgi:CheY-like chemotaxis protein
MTQGQHRPILIVEDNDEDFEATMWVLRKSPIPIPVVRCRDGEEAIHFVNGLEGDEDASLVPAIALLDLQLPQADGHHVLKRIKASALLGSLPVIIVTSSLRPRDVDNSYRLGANSYAVKPATLTKLRELVERLIEYWFHVVQLPRPGGRHAN